VPALRTGLPTASLDPVGLLAPRRRHRRVLGCLHRPAELRQLLRVFSSDEVLR
jgi:hypothetical protein